ncbi:NAD(P)H-dependent flavin oxidoreductase [Paenibacillus oleatilyticus]|uniref:Probable nitronate monooxygenase n=1 Tax=Paenibacillus oleatilyticus TaxID=2594886 RepID=A0ABV4VAY4_9BACL
MFSTPMTDLVGCTYPIIQAGMAGGPTTPELVAAVSEAGGLGTIGAGYLPPEQIKHAIEDVRRLTDRPFAVNLFTPESFGPPDETAARMNEWLNRYRERFKLAPGAMPAKFQETFEEQLQVVLDERVPVFSFTFGIPSPEHIGKLKSEGIKLIGTATTVREALALEAAGIDLIVAQGSEAGGHRGTFLGRYEDGLVGTMALVPQIVAQVRTPVIASGGIMDGRGIVASLALGACGVQMGTAFLTCDESGAHEQHKRTILQSSEEDTTVTVAFSGKAARGIKNEFISDMKKYPGPIPEYPIQNKLTQDIRKAAANENNPQYMSLWAGQALRLNRTESASKLIGEWMSEAAGTLQRLSQYRKE